MTLSGSTVRLQSSTQLSHHQLGSPSLWWPKRGKKIPTTQTRHFGEKLNSTVPNFVVFFFFFPIPAINSSWWLESHWRPIESNSSWWLESHWRPTESSSSWWLDEMIWKVFSKLNDSVILCTEPHGKGANPGPWQLASHPCTSCQTSSSTGAH